MSDPSFVDYYEALELSPKASTETVEAVFPLLSARYHPDNPRTGDPHRYKLLTMAYSVLTDPGRRPSYDSYYEQTRERQTDSDGERDDSVGFEVDRKLRLKILGLLYDSRRRDGPKGIGDYSLEQSTGISIDDLQFHLWYMTAKGWINRTDDGQVAITVAGIDGLS
ncbi:MAG: curved DNA-binding protein CbpA [Hyphomicrobiaceae bacterium]|jgi:curved DNA-binding protein CbpA